MALSEQYKKLIALGIDSSANLSDLNDMTDRGKNPMKPWTAYKTVGAMKMIRDFKITDEESFVEKFQELSKIPLETLTDQVYEYQTKYFGHYKYDKKTIFKYTYCCVVLNSLQGNSTEKKFDSWARENGMKLAMTKSKFDEVYHTDRIQTDGSDKVISLISVKPQSFAVNFMQYKDVFAGLQFMTNRYKIPWKIFYRNGSSFSEINMTMLSAENQKRIKEWATSYRLS